MVIISESEKAKLKVLSIFFLSIFVNIFLFQCNIYY
jgi:hypothetical protein